MRIGSWHLVIDCSLNTNTGQGANFHLSSKCFEVVSLTNQGADVTTQEAHWDGNQTWGGQWEDRPVSVREHCRWCTGDCWGQEDEQQTGNQTAVDGGDCTSGVESTPVGSTGWLAGLRTLQLRMPGKPGTQRSGSSRGCQG